MRIENEFTVAAPPGTVWDVPMDMPTVVSCVHREGRAYRAELTETVDTTHWKVKCTADLEREVVDSVTGQIAGLECDRWTN